MIPDRADKMESWGTRHYGAVTTALSNLVTDWEKIAKDTPKPGEEWIKVMAEQQVKSYSTALREFEAIF